MIKTITGKEIHKITLMARNMILICEQTYTKAMPFNLLESNINKLNPNYMLLYAYTCASFDPYQRCIFRQ